MNEKVECYKKESLISSRFIGDVEYFSGKGMFHTDEQEQQDSSSFLARLVHSKECAFEH